MDVNVDDLFHLPDLAQLVRVLVRVVVAAALGGLLGAERERAGKAAGLRTHMLVALGAGDLSRVIQGVATGIGFIGAGTILKRADSDEIQGLTTAASIWLTAAIGMAVGAGQLWLPVISAVAAWIILFALSRLMPPKPPTHVVPSDTISVGRP
jgi:putative Mg2+ transporter-C (MgtC) family protein